MDTSMLLAMLARQAPFLLSALNRYGGLEGFPNITNSLNSGMDPNLMEERLLNISNIGQDYDDKLGINVLENKYPSPWTDTGFPSDGQGSDFSNLFSKLNPSQWNLIGGPQAALSAATFENSPMPELSEINIIPGTNIPVQESTPSWSDSDMDDIHSSEMWEAGKKFDPNLRDWYKKNKR